MSDVFSDTERHMALSGDVIEWS